MPKLHETIFANLYAAREEDGSAKIYAKDVAKLIRVRLKREFPGIKFSVRSDHNSVDIYWTNGPRAKAVDKVVDEYSFGGFDGSIDLAYSSENWLLPDGTMRHAATSGTVGSMGYVPASYTDSPHPKAILVKYGPRYVFTHHTITDDVWEKAARIALARYGAEWEPNTPVWNRRLPHGEYVTSYLHENGEILDAVLAETV